MLNKDGLNERKLGEEPECSTSSFLNQLSEDYRMTIASNGGVFDGIAGRGRRTDKPHTLW